MDVAFGSLVVRYSVQDNHVHFLGEAAGKERLANGMKRAEPRKRTRLILLR